MAGSPHLAGQNLSSSHIQTGLRKYIMGLLNWNINFESGDAAENLSVRRPGAVPQLILA